MSSGPLSPKEIQARVDTFQRWYHRIELAPGVVTPGTNVATDSLEILDELGLPEDCTGLDVLDIGCRDGFFSFEAERRGGRVTAIDYEPAEATGFPIASEVLSSKVVFHHLDFYNLDPDVHGPFDIVLFLGVIYHLRYPILAIERCFQLLKPGGCLLLETQLTVDEDVPWKKVPSWEFVPGNAFQGDETNKWLPTPAGLKGAIGDCGFESVEVTTTGKRGLAFGRRPEEDPDGTAAVQRLRPQDGDPGLDVFLEEDEFDEEDLSSPNDESRASPRVDKMRLQIKNLARIIESRDVLVDSLYSQLDIARREIGNRDRELASQADLLRSRDGEIDSAKEQVADLEDKLTRRQEEADAGEELAANLRETLEDREAEITAARTELESVETLVEARTEEIAAALEQIEDLREVLAARETELGAAGEQIDDLRAVLSSKDTELGDLGAALEQARGTLTALGETFAGKIALKLLQMRR